MHNNPYQPQGQGENHGFKKDGFNMLIVTLFKEKEIVLKNYKSKKMTNFFINYLKELLLN